MSQFSSAAGGAASGAAAGSSVLPGVGTVVGGILGGVAGWFGGKKKKKKKKVSTLDKDQQKLNKAQHEAMYGEGPLADLYNYDPEKANEVFDKTIGRYAYRNLHEKLIPELTGQFRNKGLMQSSYAGDAVGKLVRDVQESLDAQRAQTLYNEQKEARGAKRQSVENLQNRQTFAYEQQNPSKSSGSAVDLITPENLEKVGDFAVKYLPGSII